MSTELIEIATFESSGAEAITAARYCMSDNMAREANTERAGVMLKVCNSYRTSTVRLNQKEWKALRDAIDEGFAEGSRDHGSDTLANISNVLVKRHDICSKLAFSFVMACGTESSDANVDQAVKAITKAANKAMAKLGHASQGKFETIVLPTREV